MESLLVLASKVRSNAVEGLREQEIVRRAFYGVLNIHHLHAKIKSFVSSVFHNSRWMTIFFVAFPIPEFSVIALLNRSYTRSILSWLTKMLEYQTASNPFHLSTPSISASDQSTPINTRVNHRTKSEHRLRILPVPDVKLVCLLITTTPLPRIRPSRPRTRTATRTYQNKARLPLHSLPTPPDSSFRYITAKSLIPFHSNPSTKRPSAHPANPNRDPATLHIFKRLSSRPTAPSVKANKQN